MVVVMMMVVVVVVVMAIAPVLLHPASAAPTLLGVKNGPHDPRDHWHSCLQMSYVENLEQRRTNMHAELVSMAEAHVRIRLMFEGWTSDSLACYAPYLAMPFVQVHIARGDEGGATRFAIRSLASLRFYSSNCVRIKYIVLLLAFPSLQATRIG